MVHVAATVTHVAVGTRAVGGLSDTKGLLSDLRPLRVEGFDDLPAGATLGGEGAPAEKVVQPGCAQRHPRCGVVLFPHGFHASGGDLSEWVTRS